MRDGFRIFLKRLEEERGEVVRIRESLSLVHEIPAFMRDADSADIYSRRRFSPFTWVENPAVQRP
jgi:3-polyprenyl-4-hydroxybenzoate decarboxylase